MAIVLLRHGKAAEGKDGALTPTGERQATNAGKRLADLPIRHIFTAPEDRTQETANAWAEQAKVPVTVVPDLAAWDLGRFRGDHSKPANTVVDHLLEHPTQKPPGNGESATEYWSRFMPVMLRLIQADELYGVVGHSRGIKSIEALFRGKGETMDHSVWKEPLLPSGYAVLVTPNSFEPLDT